jgi:CRP/FNR family transcriptional regulator, cyclic AMP receptor protein
VVARDVQSPVADARRLIEACDLFRGLEPGGIDALARAVRIRQYAAGESVFGLGDPSETMLAVIDGCVQISVPSPDGKEIILAIMQPGDIFGEIGLLDGKERTADARATTKSRLGVLGRRDVLGVFDKTPQALLGVVTVLCERLRRTTEQTADVALLDVPTRLAKVLVRLSRIDERATATSSGAIDPVRLSQRELGNIVGATRESVNKCLRVWQSAGIIRIENNRIEITKPDALVELTGLGEG